MPQMAWITSKFRVPNKLENKTFVFNVWSLGKLSNKTSMGFLACQYTIAAKDITGRRFILQELSSTKPDRQVILKELVAV